MTLSRSICPILIQTFHTDGIIVYVQLYYPWPSMRYLCFLQITICAGCSCGSRWGQVHILWAVCNVVRGQGDTLWDMWVDSGVSKVPRLLCRNDIPETVFWGPGTQQDGINSPPPPYRSLHIHRVSKWTPITTYIKPSWFHKYHINHNNVYVSKSPAALSGYTEDPQP